MMYSAYKLNKQGDNIQPWCIPFPIWNQPVVPCPVLMVASWPAYGFLRRQVRWSGRNTLAPWKECYDKPRQCIKKQRNHLLTKVHIVKAMVFLVVMYRCEIWTIKKIERWRIDAFQLWCWRRLLRMSWTARRSNQSVLKEISPEDWILEGLRLKLKLQYLATCCEEVTHWKRPWCWERLKAGGEGGDRGWDGQMASPTRWTLVWATSGSWWWTGEPGVLQSMGLQRARHDWVTGYSKIAPNWKLPKCPSTHSQTNENRNISHKKE